MQLLNLLGYMVSGMVLQMPHEMGRHDSLSHATKRNELQIVTRKTLRTKK